MNNVMETILFQKEIQKGIISSLINVFTYDVENPSHSVKRKHQLNSADFFWKQKWCQQEIKWTDGIWYIDQHIVIVKTRWENVVI